MPSLRAQPTKTRMMPLQGEEGLICLSDSTQIVCDGQTNMPASQDFPLLSFLPGHPDTTYLSLFIIIIAFFLFSGIYRVPCNN